MNARQGRQAKDFAKLVHKLRAHHRHPDALVIQMGNNGPLYSDDMAALLTTTARIRSLPGVD